MRISRHVYGSISGYQTLAVSSGLQPACIRALESVSIGQSCDASFQQSLASKPAWIVRSIGELRVVTRVVPGQLDDRSRPTTMRVSLILSISDYDDILRGDIDCLLQHEHLWQWDGQSQLPVTEASFRGQGICSVNPRTGRTLCDILSLLERSWEARRPVVLHEQRLGLDEFRLLCMLIPPAARSRYCGIYRSLTADVEASVICLADTASVPSSLATHRPGQPVDPSPYAKALMQAGLDGGSIPFDFIRSYRSFAMPPRQSVRPTTQRGTPNIDIPSQVIIERMPRGLLTSLLVAALLLPVISGFATYAFLKRNQDARQDLSLNAAAEHHRAFVDQLLDTPLHRLHREDRRTFLDRCRTYAESFPEVKKIAVQTRIDGIDVSSRAPTEIAGGLQLAIIPDDQNLNVWLEDIARLPDARPVSIPEIGPPVLAESIARVVGLARRHAAADVVAAMNTALISTTALASNTEHIEAAPLLDHVASTVSEAARKYRVTTLVQVPEELKYALTPPPASTAPETRPPSVEHRLDARLAAYVDQLCTIRESKRTADDRSLLEICIRIQACMKVADRDTDEYRQYLENLKATLNQWLTGKMDFTHMRPGNVKETVAWIDAILKPGEFGFNARE